MDTTDKIEGAQISPALRDITLKVHAATATSADIGAAQIELPDKQLLRELLAGTATTQSIGAAATSSPALKALVLAGLSVIVALSGVTGTGTVGSIFEGDALTGVSGIGAVGSVGSDHTGGTVGVALFGVAGVGVLGTVVSGQS